MGKADDNSDDGLTSSNRLDDLSSELGQLNLKDTAEGATAVTQVETKDSLRDSSSKASDEESNNSDNERSEETVDSTTDVVGQLASKIESIGLLQDDHIENTVVGAPVDVKDDVTFDATADVIPAADKAVETASVVALTTADKASSITATTNVLSAAAAPTAINDGEESDEDNENVPAEDGKLTADAKEDYQERGPCKVSRLQNSTLRFNPMNVPLSAADWDTTNTTFNVAAAPALGISFPDTQPLTPPDSSGQDDLLYDASPLPDVPAALFESVPGYNTPVYSSPGYAPTPTYAPDYTTDVAVGAATQNFQSVGYPNNLYDNISNDSSPSYVDSDVSSPASDLFPDTIDLEPLNAVTQQFEGSALSPNYLDALEHAVERSVSERPGRDESSNMRLIMDGLCSIDPTELDYIAPASPGLTHGDLEQELALSAEPWSDQQQLCGSPSPPLSPNSLPSSPFSMYGDSCPPCVEDVSCNKLQDHVALVQTAIDDIKKLCSSEVILRAAKRVACQRSQDLCRKDSDGDTCYMIVVCKPSNSPNFYENLFVLQQHLLNLRLCCDTLLASNNDACPQCGEGPRAWRTPLSDHNNVGDSVLTCAVKMRHPECVINYLCAGLANCHEDMRRVFSDATTLTQYTRLYPVLSRFLKGVAG